MTRGYQEVWSQGAAAHAQRQIGWGEWVMWGGLIALLCLAVGGPAVSASPHQHHFADQRMLWGVPCALDVLSNLPFAVLGAMGLWQVRGARASGLDAVSAGLARLFFGGLLCTFVGSAVYHWGPDNSGLLWDRLGMCVAFAGMLGLAVMGRVRAGAGVAVALVWLVAGPLAVGVWAATGNLLPWAVVQFGGMLLIVVLAAAPQRGPGLPVSLWAVVGWYTAAKGLEMADHEVFALTGQWISGHTLKHLAAAGAALPVYGALARWQHAPRALGHVPGVKGIRVQNGGR